MFRRGKPEASASSSSSTSDEQAQFEELLQRLASDDTTVRDRQRAAHALSVALAKDGHELEACLSVCRARDATRALVSLGGVGGGEDALCLSLSLACLTNLGKHEVALVNRSDVGALVARSINVSRSTGDASLRGYALAAGFSLSVANLIATEMAPLVATLSNADSFASDANEVRYATGILSNLAALPAASIATTDPASVKAVAHAQHAAKKAASKLTKVADKLQKVEQKYHHQAEQQQQQQQAQQAQQAQQQQQQLQQLQQLWRAPAPPAGALQQLLSQRGGSGGASSGADLQGLQRLLAAAAGPSAGAGAVAAPSRAGYDDWSTAGYDESGSLHG